MKNKGEKDIFYHTFMNKRLLGIMTHEAILLVALIYYFTAMRVQVLSELNSCCENGSDSKRLRLHV